MFGYIDITEFEADDGFVDDLWGNGDFTTSDHVRYVTFTVRDKRRGRHMSGATTSLDGPAASTHGSPDRSSVGGFSSPMQSPMPHGFQQFQQHQMLQQQQMQHQMHLQQQMQTEQAKQQQQALSALMASFQGLAVQSGQLQQQVQQFTAPAASAAIVPSPRLGPPLGLPLLQGLGGPQGFGGPQPPPAASAAAGLGDRVPNLVGGIENVHSPGSLGGNSFATAAELDGTHQNKRNRTGN